MRDYLQSYYLLDRLQWALQQNYYADVFQKILHNSKQLEVYTKKEKKVDVSNYFEVFRRRHFTLLCELQRTMLAYTQSTYLIRSKYGIPAVLQVVQGCKRKARSGLKVSHFFQYNKHGKIGTTFDLKIVGRLVDRIETSI